MAFFEFVRRERIYFFGILFCLVLTVLFQRSPETAAPVFSAEFEQLQEKAENLNLHLRDQAAWIRVLTQKPEVVLAWLGMMTLFGMIFSAGAVLLAMRNFHRGISAYFRQGPSASTDLAITPTHVFRIGVLIYILCVVLALAAGVFLEAGLVNETALGIVQTLILDASVCLVIFKILKQGGISWREFMGPRPASVWFEIRRGIAEYLIVFPWFVLSLIFLLSLAAFFQYEPPPHPLVEVFVQEQTRGMKTVFFGAILLAAVAAPVMEELFFRGFCYRFFKRLCGIGPAILFSSAFFALLHGSWFTFLPIFVLGWGLARLYEKSGNFIACWTFHVLHNILFTVYFFSAKAIVEAFHG